jgi:hypothetical protein
VTTKSHILQAIRTKCLDCSVYQPSEVRLCPVKTCALWPFRLGSDPAPAARGFAKTSGCTGGSLGRIVPGYGDSAAPGPLEKSLVYTDDFSEGAAAALQPQEIG